MYLLFVENDGRAVRQRTVLSETGSREVVGTQCVPLYAKRKREAKVSILCSDCRKLQNRNAGTFVYFFLWNKGKVH